jgi:hypothetical protein
MAAVTLPRGGFWLQHAARSAEQLVAYADELAHEPAGRPGIIMAPVNAPNTLTPLFQRARASGDAILDPNGHLIDRTHTERARNHFPWLAQDPRPGTQAAWEAWMEQGVAHQLSAALRGTGAGPSFVITPSPIVTAASGQADLYMVLDAAAAVRANHPTENLWLGLAVDRVYARENPHLTRLANAIVSSGVRGIVLRAFHGELPPATDRRYLEGLRELTHAAYAGGVELLLPHAGWLGWLAMCWGAWSFSGGMAANTWGDREPGPMTRPDEPSNPYFEPQLLRTVRWRVHLDLVTDPNYQPCPCPECTSLGTTYDGDLAKRHQIWWANEEAARLAPLALPQRKFSVGGRLDAAILFRDSLSQALRQRIDAGFLDTWRALV